jgi:hypothetical protein
MKWWVFWAWRILGVLPSSWFLEHKNGSDPECFQITIVAPNRALWIGNRVFDLRETVVWGAQHPWGQIIVKSTGSDYYKYKSPPEYEI